MKWPFLLLKRPQQAQSLTGSAVAICPMASWVTCWMRAHPKAKLRSWCLLGCNGKSWHLEVSMTYGTTVRSLTSDHQIPLLLAQMALSCTGLEPTWDQMMAIRGGHCHPKIRHPVLSNWRVAKDPADWEWGSVVALRTEGICSRMRLHPHTIRQGLATVPTRSRNQPIMHDVTVGAYAADFYMGI
jgi:hypothetical protein